MRLRQSFPHILLCIFFDFAVVLPFTGADGETKIFINGPYITGYSQLTSCAVEPLSTIVRGMSSGCGDDGSLTSYTCFCTGSSSKMNSIISSVVSTECKSHSNVTSFVTAQISSAIAVFDSYCALGVNATTTSNSVLQLIEPFSIIVSSKAAASTTASPAATSVLATSTASPETSSSSSSSDDTRTTAIAAGVAVPIATISLALGAFFLYKARRSNAKLDHAGTNGAGDGETGEAGGGGDLKTHDVKGAAVDRNGDVGELASEQRFEMEGDPAEQTHEAGGNAVYQLDDQVHREARVEKDGMPVIPELDAESGRQKEC